MVKTDESVDTYRENLKKTYSPETSLEDIKLLLDYFLTVKSKTVELDTSKDVSDAIAYLKTRLNSQGKWYKEPLGIIFLSAVVILIAKFIKSYFFS